MPSKREYIARLSKHGEIRGFYRNITANKSEKINRIHPKVPANLDHRMATIL